MTQAAGAPAGQRLPVVAIVGRPNVGKSSLVNRVLARREAIVEKRPGVTRDRRSFTTEWNGHRFELIDTGGLELGAEGIEARAAEQARAAIEVADTIVLVTDVDAGPGQDDHVVAQLLRRSGKPVVLVVNKVDDARAEPGAVQFHRLGLGDPVPVSALHGRNTGDFLDRLVALLPAGSGAPDAAWASVAIVGRPNVGKSSLLNALLGRERAIVDPEPGTTRDPVDSWLETGAGRLLRLVDTAGMRRRVGIEEPLEYFSWLRSSAALKRSDAAVLVVDASQGVTASDQRIAREIADLGRACVIALNKWDLTPGEDLERDRLEAGIAARLRFLSWARDLRTSALTGRGVRGIVPALEQAVGSHRKRLPTSRVNDIIAEAQRRNPHPRTGGRAARVLYAVQAGVAPPEIVLFASGPLEESYLRYLENHLRRAEPFDGSPIRLKVRLRPPRH